VWLCKLFLVDAVIAVKMKLPKTLKHEPVEQPYSDTSFCKGNETFGQAQTCLGCFIQSLDLGKILAMTSVCPPTIQLKIESK
jgi:hypothetical protein